MASKYRVMRPLASLLAEILFKNGILFGDYIHFKAAAHRQAHASAMGNPQSSSDQRLPF